MNQPQKPDQNYVGIQWGPVEHQKRQISQLRDRSISPEDLAWLRKRQLGGEIKKALDEYESKQPNKPAPVPEQGWEPGQLLLDDFEVQRVLGQGGMGKVYLVRSQTTGMEFAVKHALIKDDNSRQNFLSELQTWIDLPEHPHIAACRFFRTIGDEIAIFAEYVSGGTLADWIRDRRLVTLDQILDNAIQFAWGLQALHEHGLIHQDVKPGNVLMTPEGIAKVTDFGLSRARSRGSDEQFHSPAPAPDGQSMLVSFGGMTQAYCSPEQAAKQPLSRKTDIWSWGVSVLDMFYGEMSCRHGQAAGESLEAYFQEGVLDQELPRMPVEMTMILGKCFLPKPEQRWDSMTEVADALLQTYEKLCDRSYSKKAPIASAGTNLHAPSHDRRTGKGGGWTDPQLWLRIALKAIGRDPAEAVVPPRAGSRHAQAIGDLSVYEDAFRIFEPLVASGRKDLQVLFGELCIEKAVVHSQTGDLLAAVALYGRAIEIYERLVVQEGQRECRNHLATAYMNKAELVGNLGEAQNALELFDRAIELREQLVNQERRHEFADDLAAAYMNKAGVLSGQGDNRSAAALCERATEILERLVNKEGRQELAGALATAFMSASGVFMRMEDDTTAVAFIDRAIEIHERLAKQGELKESANLAAAYVNKAVAAHRLGDIRGAGDFNDRAIEVYERLIRQGERECRDRLATAYTHKAIRLSALGDNRGSLEFFDRAIELREKLVKQEGVRELSQELARTYVGKANVVNALENYRGAVDLFDSGIAIYQGLVDREGRKELFGDLARFKAYRAATLINLGERTSGLKEAHAAIADLRTAVAGTGRADLQAVLSWLIEVLTEAGYPISTSDSEAHPMKETDPSNKCLAVDEAAEALFAMMRQPFNREWLSGLATVSGLDLTRAETELVFLDFFAIHFGLRVTRSPGWQDKGHLVSEKLFSIVSKWWGDALESNNRGTIDDAFKILDGRLKAYESVTERLHSADPEEMIRSLSLMYAMFALAEDSFFGPDGRPTKDRYPDHLTKLLLDYRNVVSAVGAEVLRCRMHTLQTIFDSFTLK